jgi:hypothetical protein
MGVVDYLGQRIFKGLTNSDALANAAVSRYQSPNAMQLQSRPGLFPRSVSAVGEGLRTVGKMAPDVMNPRKSLYGK